MRCRRCLNDGSVRNLELDKDGVCNFCRNYDRISDKLNDYDYLEGLFTERLDRVRGRYKYDAALGISGGKDSVYVLNELKKKYKLKIMTFTMDNGFLSSDAKRNIDKIVKEFDVDHEYVTFDPELLKRVYHHSMKHWLTPCIACSYIGYASMISYANKVGAGMCIHGRSPEQMLRYYGKDVFTSFIDLGLEHIDKVNLSKSYLGLLDGVKDKVDEGIFNDIKSIAFDSIEDNDFREFVPYFLYHKYDEAEIISYLKSNTDWEPPKEYNHFDCEIHNAAKYINQCAEGRPHRLPEISVLVRMGSISRDEGIMMLEREHMDEKPKTELNRLCRYAGINQTLLFAKAGIYSRIIKK